MASARFRRNGAEPATAVAMTGGALVFDLKPGLYDHCRQPKKERAIDAIGVSALIETRVDGNGRR
jgi:hypothetical protein